jgi:hypothetical protein
MKKVKYTNRRRYRDLSYIEKTQTPNDQIEPYAPTNIKKLEEKKKTNFEKFKEIFKKIIKK